MPSKNFETVWDAVPHTIAKITILKSYLNAWFRIMGTTKFNQEILHIDGFAGPGKYKNYDEGSPVAALKAAQSAIDTSGLMWKAGNVHCAFIEADKKRFDHLQQEIKAWEKVEKLKTYPLKMSFHEGLTVLRDQLPKPFEKSQPLFVFIDPFGATGAPFTCVAEILNSPCSEVLINLDADGIARIFRAEESANSEETLNSIFGDSSWKTLPGKEASFSELNCAVLDLYKTRLRSLTNIRFVFAFEMQTTVGVLNYFLVFASQHPLGLAKMKEAMKTIDQDGNYRFADGSLSQPSLFRFNDPAIYSPRLFDRFQGKTVSYDVLNEFALNETVFVNPKSMLKDLELRDRIKVLSQDPKRRKGTFSQTENLRIQFEKGDANG
jgi:three-Cys-motif partner protein